MVGQKPESRSLERPDEENGHQPGDADPEDQERQLLALSSALQGVRFGVHHAASLPQPAPRDNGPTVEGTGVTCPKFCRLVRLPSGAEARRNLDAFTRR